MRTIVSCLPLSGVFAILVIGLPAHAAPYVWHLFDGHMYALTQNRASWTSAEAEAVAAGGHLATINSEAENQFLLTTFNGSTSAAGNPIAWIGLLRTDVDQDDWHWISGEPLTYFRNDYFMWPQGGTKVYLHLPAHDPQPGTWNANPFHDEIVEGMPQGIIEVPEPGTMLLLLPAAIFITRRTTRRARSTRQSSR